jgi:hypothetical protein
VCGAILKYMEFAGMVAEMMMRSYFVVLSVAF